MICCVAGWTYGEAQCHHVQDQILLEGFLIIAKLRKVYNYLPGHTSQPIAPNLARLFLIRTRHPQLVLIPKRYCSYPAECYQFKLRIIAQTIFFLRRVGITSNRALYNSINRPVCRCGNTYTNCMKQNKNFIPGKYHATDHRLINTQSDHKYRSGLRFRFRKLALWIRTKSTTGLSAKLQIISDESI